LYSSTFCTDDLIPGLPPTEQLKLLRIKERLLMIDRWEETWEQVRPPRTHWYALKNGDFSQEMRRSGRMLKYKGLQRAEEQCRVDLLDLQRTIIFDANF
jgi:hypothetical protein